jgi:hypothetical protein
VDRQAAVHANVWWLKMGHLLVKDGELVEVSGVTRHSQDTVMWSVRAEPTISHNEA